MHRYAYLVGGRLGDFMHVLYVVYMNYKIHQVEADIYLTEASEHGAVPFQRPLHETKQELEVFLQHCAPYVKRVHLLTEHPMDTTMYQRIVNLNDWRSQNSCEWLLLLQDTYQVPICSDAWCMPSPTWNPPEGRYIVLHRSLHRHNASFPWEEVLTKLETLQMPIYFLTCDVQEYLGFPYREKVLLKHCQHVMEMAYWIHYAHVMVGNQSSPLAMAMAFGKTSIVELNESCVNDAITYLNTTMAHGKVYYYLNVGIFRTIKYL